MITIPSDYLQLGKQIPFRVYDEQGRLLVAAGRVIDDERRLAGLQERALFADEKEASPWSAGFEQSADALMQKDVTLEVIAAARTDERRRGGASSSADSATPQRTSPTAYRPAAAASGAAAHREPAANRRQVISAAAASQQTLSERCNALVAGLGTALRDAERDPQWLDRIVEVLAMLRELARFQRNGLLYLLLQHAAHSNAQYSCHHALLCTLVCEGVGTSLGWSGNALNDLARAALTMNVSMTQLQDQLAQRDDPLRPAQRSLVQSHAARSGQILRASDVTNLDWLDIVEQHHDDQLLRRPLQTLRPTERLTRLLIMTDRFVAKVSRRGSRHPMSPLAAARDVCVGPDGQPDELGSALLKTLGMYPPGSYVQLASGEVGVVVAPGRRMNHPLVAVFIGTTGMPTTEPVLRDTAQPARAVMRAVPVADVKVQVQPERALALV
ncbi:MAG: hypothetical protein ABI574_05165 [Burkholderiales bacterium]